MQPKGCDFLLQRRHLLAQGFAQANEIRALLLVDEDAHRRLAVDAEHRTFRLETEIDLGDVAELRRAVGDDPRLAQRMDAARTAIDEHLNAPVLGFQGADVAHAADLPRNRLHHLLRRRRGGREPLRI